MFVVVLVAVVAGALAQRLAGLGFGLLVAPVLVVLLGPFDGVMIVSEMAVSPSSFHASRIVMPGWR